MPAPKTLLIVEADAERSKQWSALVREWWPAAHTVIAKTFMEAEELLLQEQSDGLILTNSATDDHPLNFLSNVRILRPAIWAVLLGDEAPSDRDKLPLGILAHGNPTDAGLSQMLRDTLGEHVEFNGKSH